MTIATLPVPPVDSCDECRVFVVMHPITAKKGEWLRGRFSHWDQRAHWLDRGDMNKSVDVEPVYDAPCGAFFKGAVAP